MRHVFVVMVYVSANVFTTKMLWFFNLRFRASPPVKRPPPRKTATTTCLLIVDPQYVYASRNGAMAVHHVVDFLRKDAIHDVVVTMDAHQKYHITHAGYWVDAAGKHPKPYTIISIQDARTGRWSPVRAEEREWAVEYLTQLQTEDRQAHVIWPEHCLMGSVGQAIDPKLFRALAAWEAAAPGRAVQYVQKGNDAITPTRPLAEHLMRFERVVVAGEAASHCVSWTVRDLVGRVPGIAPKLVLAAHMTTTSAVDEEREVDKRNLIQDVIRAGGRVVYDNSQL